MRGVLWQGARRGGDGGETCGLVERELSRYALAVIEHCRHRGLRLLLENGNRRGVPPAHAAKIERILDALDAAAGPHELDLNGLHALRGDRRGYWAVTVSANWRITFRFDGGDVYDLDLVDYH